MGAVDAGVRGECGGEQSGEDSGLGGEASCNNGSMQGGDTVLPEKRETMVVSA